MRKFIIAHFKKYYQKREIITLGNDQEQRESSLKILWTRK